MEAGDRIRALIVEMKEFISVSGRNWEEAACPQLPLSGRMSPVNRLNSDKLGDRDEIDATITA